MYIKNYICGHVVESVEVLFLPAMVDKYRKLDKNRMVDIETGEIIDVKHAKTRAEQTESLRRSIRNLRMVINANFFGESNELFITLTYAENMQDLKKLYRDFEVFYKRLKRKYKGYGFEYIAVPEPQLRGSWHLHVLLKAMDKEYLYIPNNEVIAELWGQGFTKTERLKEVDNVGAYVSSYLTNLYDEDTGVKSKGARLYLYPTGMRLYRCSRGIKKPETVEGYLKIDDKYKVYERQFDIIKGDEVVNKVTIKQYNMKRGNSSDF
jgi:hypothetical protein